MSDARPQIIPQFEYAGTSLNWAQIEQLIAELFQDESEVARVVVTNLPGSSIGLSSISLLLALPFTSDNAQYNPVAVRIGAHSAIAHERENYRRYIDSSIGIERVQLRYASQETSSLAAIGYSYLSQTDQPIRTLRDYLWHTTNQQPAIQAIRTLFAETLARDGGLQNGWHHDARCYPDQRPGWFYNRMLPPALTIEDVTIGSGSRDSVQIATALADADQPGSGLSGQRIALATGSIFSDLRVVAEDRSNDGQQLRLRLHLLEGPTSEGGIYRPFEPLAGRLELRIPPALLPRVKDALATRTPLNGRIVDTRHAALSRHIEQHGLRPSGDLPGLEPAHAGRTIRDPLGAYGELLGAMLPLHTSIIHGDLNLGNILIRVYGPGSERSPSAWLIDFDQTGPGGHTVFDLVKLETEYKLHLLPHRLHSQADFLRLEAALHAALINPSWVERLLGDDQNLIQAYEFIAALRQIALCPPKGARPQPIEYYLGLIGYGLAAIKFVNLYPQQRERWLLPTARVEPLAVAAYLSAAFATTVIDEVRNTGVVAESYQPPILKRQRRPPPALFSGQNLVAETAYQRLRRSEPLVVIYGPAGSGRESVADHIGYQLERAGYSLIAPKPLRPISPHQSAFIDIGDHILGDLMSVYEVHNLPERLSSTPVHDSPGYRHGQIRSFCQRLAGALASDGRRFAFILPLRSGDPEMVDLASELARTLSNTPLVCIASAPLSDLPAQWQLAIPPLTHTDLRAYAQHRQIDLSDARIEMLLHNSGGLPLLIERLLDQPEEDWQQRSESLAPAIARGVQQILEGFDQRLLLLAGIDDLLATSGYVDRDSDLEGIARLLNIPNCWSSSLELHAALGAYRAEVGEGLRELLHEVALERFLHSPEYRTACVAAASYYASFRTPQPYLAARYAANAENWHQAEAHLHPFISQPALVHSVSRRDQLYNLACDLLASRQVEDSISLLLLAGDCATFLGNYDSALEAYYRVSADVLPGDPRELRALAQIMAVYQARGERDEADAAALLLRQAAPPDHPLAVLAIAHRGIALVQRGNPHAAEEPLQQAIDLLAPRAGELEWGELYARLSDWRARALIMRGDYDQAIMLLRLARNTASQVLRDPALGAMLDNDLGIAYSRRSRPGDRKIAQSCFERSFNTREQLGDKIGMLRAGQNLAIEQFELARSATEWSVTESLYKRVLHLAHQTQDFDAAQVYSNYLDLLIRRGDTSAIDQVIAHLKARPDAGGFARARGEINVAIAWFWRGQPAACAQELSALADDLADDADRIQQAEWATLWLKLSLRYGLPCDTALITSISAQATDINEGPFDSAFLQQLRGLLAAVSGDHATAQVELNTARRLFAEIGFAYNAASTALWQAEAALASGQPTTRLAEQAIVMLAPFGETPALIRARTLAVSDGGM